MIGHPESPGGSFARCIIYETSYFKAQTAMTVGSDHRAAKPQDDLLFLADSADWIVYPLRAMYAEQCST